VRDLREGWWWFKANGAFEEWRPVELQVANDGQLWADQGEWCADETEDHNWGPPIHHPAEPSRETEALDSLIDQAEAAVGAAETAVKEVGGDAVFECLNDVRDLIELVREGVASPPIASATEAAPTREPEALLALLLKEFDEGYFVDSISESRYHDSEAGLQSADTDEELAAVLAVGFSDHLKACFADDELLATLRAAPPTPEGGEEPYGWLIEDVDLDNPERVLREMFIRAPSDVPDIVRDRGEPGERVVTLYADPPTKHAGPSTGERSEWDNAAHRAVFNIRQRTTSIGRVLRKAREGSVHEVDLDAADSAVDSLEELGDAALALWDYASAAPSAGAAGFAHHDGLLEVFDDEGGVIASYRLPAPTGEMAEVVGTDAEVEVVRLRGTPVDPPGLWREVDRSRIYGPHEEFGMATVRILDTAAPPTPDPAAEFEVDGGEHHLGGAQPGAAPSAPEDGSDV